MGAINLQEMVDAGAQFGHQTKRWNPKMRPYIYGARSGVHILDLQQTLTLAQNAFNALVEIVAQGGTVLFVGTKSLAQKVIEEEAKRCSMPYVSQRWLGGMLTNFGTIRKSVEKLIDLETRRQKNDFAGFTKKELLGVDRTIVKLLHALGGIKEMRKLPAAIFVVDPHEERIAVHEANILDIPVIAITDSNCDPDPVDYLIPANDDSIRSIKIFAQYASEACLLGLEKKQALALKEESKKGDKPKKLARTQEIENSGQAYVGKKDVFEAVEDVDSYSAKVVEEEKGVEIPEEID